MSKVDHHHRGRASTVSPSRSSARMVNELRAEVADPGVHGVRLARGTAPGTGSRRRCARRRGGSTSGRGCAGPSGSWMRASWKYSKWMHVACLAGARRGRRRRTVTGTTCRDSPGPRSATGRHSWAGPREARRRHRPPRRSRGGRAPWRRAGRRVRSPSSAASYTSCARVRPLPPTSVTHVSTSTGCRRKTSGRDELDPVTARPAPARRGGPRRGSPGPRRGTRGTSRC